MQAPTHTAAIEEVIADVGEETPETETRSLAYVAEKIDRRPDQEPEEIFFLRRQLTTKWTVIDGDDVRTATDEEAEAIAKAGHDMGAIGMKNSRFRRLKAKSLN